jgi:hypothetical protein
MRGRKLPRDRFFDREGNCITASSVTYSMDGKNISMLMDGRFDGSLMEEPSLISGLM